MSRAELGFEVGSYAHGEVACDFAENCLREAFSTPSMSDLPEDKWDEAGKFKVNAFRAAIADPTLLLRAPRVYEEAQDGDSN